MQLRHLSIRNFRGIRRLDWPIPSGNIVCLIGRGDARKSTILEAIRRLFHPQWNLAFDDSDFYQCIPANTITIEAVLGDVPDEFRDFERYGYVLSGWNADLCQPEPDPGEGFEDAIRVRLEIRNDLEPSWTVIKQAEKEGVPFKASDRAKVAVSLIGAVSDRHLTWSKGSVLSQLTKVEDINQSLADAARAAKTALDEHRERALSEFDRVASEAEKTARLLGVNVASSYKAHLDAGAVDVRVGGLTLHDGSMPLRQLGLGSKRMLTTGLQQRALQASHITLIDEVEIGLEPHRIARLLHHFKADTTGQYFMTTHSPVVLRELTVLDLHIVHCSGDELEIVEADKPAIADSIQGKIRLGAEAFLAPKIIVCEGATEVGFLRGLNAYWSHKGKPSFAYQGVALFDAHGASKIRGIAEGVAELRYRVAVLADSDEPKKFSDNDAAYLCTKSVHVAKWEGACSIEGRVFSDLPWRGVIASFGTAVRIHGDLKSCIDQVGSQYGGDFNRNWEQWTDSERLRKALGQAAHASGWFKRQDWAQEWVASIEIDFDNADIQQSDLMKKVSAIRDWIDAT